MLYPVFVHVGDDEHAHDSDYVDGTWIFVDVDVNQLNAKKERANLPIPVYVLKEIDAFANAHGYNRSGFMVQAALKATRK